MYCFFKKFCYILTSIFYAVPNKVTPRVLRVTRGKSANFTCESNYEVVWYRRGSDIPLVHSQHFFIPIVGPKSREYECKSTNQNGDVFRSIARLEVIGIIIIHSYLSIVS